MSLARQDEDGHQRNWKDISERLVVAGFGYRGPFGCRAKWANECEKNEQHIENILAQCITVRKDISR